MKPHHKLPWLRIFVHALGIFPLASLLLAALAGGLGVNPIQEIEQRLGRAALYLLVATLSITPLVTLSGWRHLLPRRRSLGLYTFLYAALHFFTFVAIDYSFNLQEVGRLIVEKPFILVGLLTGLILLPLAVTSFPHFMRNMGKRWKKLHRLVYLAGIGAVLHFAWVRKGDLFSLGGDILQPLLTGLLVLLLLALRIPAIRMGLSAWRAKNARRPSS